MKKILSMLIALSILLGCSAAMAEMGVQIIGGSLQEEGQPVSLDDMQLEEAVEVEGWGTITLTSCCFMDSLYQFKEGKHEVAGNWNVFDSGLEADYLLIQADILNNTKNAHDYLSDVEVKAVFDDDVEFAGWFWQYNWDNGTKDYDWGELNGIQNKEFVIAKADQFAIDPYYAGHYCFGCTLPNAVVNGEQPLRLEIRIDGNEITYNIRK